MKTEQDKLYKTLRYGIIIYIIGSILKTLLFIIFIFGIIYISMAANGAYNKIESMTTTNSNFGNFSIVKNYSNYLDNKTLVDEQLKGIQY